MSTSVLFSRLDSSFLISCTVADFIVDRKYSEFGGGERKGVPGLSVISRCLVVWVSRSGFAIRAFQK